LECGAFRGWVPKPQNAEIREKDNAFLREMIDSGKLNAWEKSFCECVLKTKKRSQKQLFKIEAIGDRLGIKKA
jgi:hypothetical protein